MNRKKPDITQEICDQVKFLIKGGATNRKAGRFVGLSATTVSRIRTADYNAEQYRKNNEIRNAEEKKETEKEPNRMEDLLAAEDNQVPGQMAMDLQPEDDGAKEMAEYLHCEDAPAKKVDIVSFMRLYAGKTGELITWISEACVLLHRNMEKLDKINDNLCQILRRLDK